MTYVSTWHNARRPGPGRDTSSDELDTQAYDVLLTVLHRKEVGILQVMLVKYAGCGLS